MAAGLACATLLAYLPLLQARIYGDGALILPLLARSGAEFGSPLVHPLALEVAKLARPLVPGVDPGTLLRALSAAWSALGVACTYRLCLELGAERASAWLAGLLLATAPALVFFGTTIEVHAVHFGAVALCAWLVARTGRGGLRARVAAAVALPLVQLSHTSGVLLWPGFLALAWLTAGREAPRVRATWIGVVGIALIAGAALSAWLRGTTLFGLFEHTRGVAGSLPLRFEPQKLLSAWLAGTGLLVLLALVGLASSSRRRAAGVLLAFVAPSALFFLLWGPAERGGYFLGCAPFAAALAALGMPTSRRSARIALLCGALLQGAYAAVEVRRFDDPSWERYQEERAAAVQSARASRPDSARVVLFSFDEHRQPIETRLPDAMEHNLLPLLKAPEAAALSVDALVAGLAGQVAEVLRDPRTLLLVDLGGWEGVPSLKEQRSTDFPAAFERHLRDTYRTREAAVGSGLLLTVELPSAESLPR